MTQFRWAILLVVFLFPTVTDMLFKEVSSIWLVGCTVLVLFWNLCCGFNILTVCLSLLPGILLWMLSRVSRGIGFGDVLGAFLLGVVAGFPVSLEILFGGSILCLVAQILLMVKDNVRQLQIRKEKDKETNQNKSKFALKKEENVLLEKVLFVTKKEKNKFQSEMPFVPWILASIWINWALQIVFS